MWIKTPWSEPRNCYKRRVNMSHFLKFGINQNFFGKSGLRIWDAWSIVFGKISRLKYFIEESLRKMWNSFSIEKVRWVEIKEFYLASKQSSSHGRGYNFAGDPGPTVHSVNPSQNKNVIFKDYRLLRVKTAFAVILGQTDTFWVKSLS